MRKAAGQWQWLWRVKSFSLVAYPTMYTVGTDTNAKLVAHGHALTRFRARGCHGAAGGIAQGQCALALGKPIGTS